MSVSVSGSFDYVPVESTRLFSAAPYSLDCKLCVRYSAAPVFFLLSRRGNGMECHIGADGREGRRALRQAGTEFLQWLPRQYPWCEMIIAPVLKRSVLNYCKNMGFIDLGVQPFDGGRTRLLIYKFGE